MCDQEDEDKEKIQTKTRKLKRTSKPCRNMLGTLVKLHYMN